jgi:hypothetical protein
MASLQESQHALALGPASTVGVWQTRLVYTVTAEEDGETVKTLETANQVDALSTASKWRREGLQVRVAISGECVVI